MTDGQSFSLFWCQAPICGIWQDFYYCQTVAGLLMWCALSEERTGLYFTISAGYRERSHSRSRVPWGSWSYISVSDSRLSKPGGVGPRIFLSHRSSLAQILVSLFVASYDSQGYGGGIRIAPHVVSISPSSLCPTVLIITSRHGSHRNHRSSVAENLRLADFTENAIPQLMFKRLLHSNGNFTNAYLVFDA
jgi:hypothetical protein